MKSSVNRQLINPYQGKLTPLLVEQQEIAEWQQRIAKDNLPSIVLSSREAGDLDMLAIGGFSPLQGFMSYDDWQGVCSNMQTSSGYFWPIPITLATAEDNADKLTIDEHCQLVDKQGELVGVMLVEDKYKSDKSFEAKNVFGTDDEQHPGVANLYAHSDIYVGGKVKVFRHSKLKQQFPKVYLTPAETRAKFQQRGWSKVVAFQTRNPMHLAHEHLVKTALQECDGVLVHSLLGNLKAGDIPVAVRVHAIDALLKNYFEPNSVINAGYPLDMRYAGPREALLHALFRQNYGCSQLIVGRDHAGVGDYYDPFAAQRIFAEIPPDAMQIKPLKLEWAFWCKKCKDMVSNSTCTHEAKYRLMLSGTKIRELLVNNEPIPQHFSRPEVLEILREYYENS